MSLLRDLINTIRTEPKNPIQGETLPPSAVSETSLPAMPVPPSQDPQTRRFFDGVKENLEVLTGRRGSKYDRAVTWRDMFDQGLVDFKINGNRFSGQPVNPFVIGAGMDTDFSVPPAPENVEAAGAFANIILTWDKPVFRSFAYAEIFRSDEDNVGLAQKIGTTSAHIYADNVGAVAATKFYWVRFVNLNGVVGPFQSGPGVSATTAQDPAQLLQMLTGSITQSQLYSDLSTKIDRIDTKSRVYYQETAPTGDEQFPLAIGDIWIDTSVTYYDDYVENSGDYVIRSNRMHRWDGANWVDIMDFGFRDWFTAINTEKTERVNANEAVAARVDSVEAVANANSAAISYETLARTTAIDSLASYTYNLNSVVATNKSLADAAISSEQTARTNADSALSTSITNLSSQFTNQYNSLSAAIQQEQSARANADYSQAQQISTVQASLTSVNNSLTSITASVQQEASARLNADGSINAKYTVKIDAANHVAGFGLIGTGNYDNPSYEFGIRADKFWIAPPAYVDMVAPTSNLYVGRVWVDNSVSPNVTRYWTGSAWSTTPQNLPFVILTSPTNIGGQYVPAGVYIQDAYIANGTISNAKIANLAVDDAKIASLSAAKITTGYLDAARIESGTLDAKIANIDAAKITTGYINTARIDNASINIAKIDTASITNLSSLNANMGTITAGKLQSGDGKFVVNLDEKYIRIEV